MKFATSRAALLAAAVTVLAVTATAQTDPDTRVIDYIRDHLRAGEPLIVTDLYNKVFTKPEERRALDKLYKSFFRIPLFVAEYQEKYGAPPTLKTIAEQFDLRDGAAADVLLKVMEADPRVPAFLTRDQATGEITAIDRERIHADAQFGSAIERQLSGWEGRPAPEFTLQGLTGKAVNSADLRGKLTLLYIWFTGCPPCMKETPALVQLSRELSARSFVVVGANADRMLGLPYQDSVRSRYAEEQKINFPLAHWNKESDAAFGGITIYPTLFLIGRDGVVSGHWIGYVTLEDLHRDVTKTLENSR